MSRRNYSKKKISIGNLAEDFVGMSNLDEDGSGGRSNKIDFGNRNEIGSGKQKPVRRRRKITIDFDDDEKDEGVKNLEPPSFKGSQVRNELSSGKNTGRSGLDNNKQGSMDQKKKTRQIQRKGRFRSDENTVSGRFKLPYECGGYRSHLNPQVEFIISENSTVKMTLETALGYNDAAIVFFVTNPSREIGRCASLNDEDLVCRSEYVRSHEVSSETTLSPGRYVAVMSLEHEELEGPFTFTVTCTHCEKMKILPDYDRRFIRGSWKEWSGGYKSPKNPQYSLSIKKPTHLVIRVEDKSPENAIFIFLTKASQRGKRRIVIEEEEIICHSDYVRSDVLQLEVDVTPTGPKCPYIIIPCSSSKDVALDFTLIVESDVRGVFGEFREINDEGSGSVRECSCEEILDKHRDYENPPYMITNPVPDIIKFCTENNCLFIDEDFPANEKSLNRDDGRDVPLLKEVAGWKRGREFLEHPDLYCDGIEIQDMRQGKLGDCWLCQGIATSCMKEDRISSLISPSKYTPIGVYALKMYHEDAWKYMVVDDYFPVDKNDEFIFARSQDKNELFVPLMEKAFAKEFRSYRSLARRSMGVALEFLTGGESSVKLHQDTTKEEIWNQLKEYDDRNWLMGASSKDTDEDSQGIKGKHAYSIMSVHGIDDKTKLLKIRNTWGNFEWEGAWGDGDTQRWTPELKERLNFQNLDDGIFHMCIEDYFEYFASTSFCRIVKDIYPHSSKYRGDWGPPNPWCDPEKLRGETCKKIPLKVLHEGTSLHITLIRTSNDIDVEDNAIMLIMVRGEVTTNAISSAQIFRESRYMISIKTMIEEKNVPRGLYTLIPASSNRFEEYTVIVSSDRPVEFGGTWKDPHPYSISTSGEWTPCAGVLRWDNPILALSLEEEEGEGGPMSVVIDLKRVSSNPAHNKLGMLIVVAKPGVDYNKKNRHPQALQHETVAKSKYVGGEGVSLALDLERSEKPYLILISMEKQVKGVRYKVSVKASGEISLRNDREEVKTLKRKGTKKKLIEM